MCVRVASSSVIATISIIIIVITSIVITIVIRDAQAQGFADARGRFQGRLDDYMF